MSITRSRKSRNPSISVTPECAEWYRFLVSYHDQYHACSDLDYPAVCESHYLCERYYDWNTKLTLALHIAPWEPSPLCTYEEIQTWPINGGSVAEIKHVLDAAVQAEEGRGDD